MSPGPELESELVTQVELPEAGGQGLRLVLSGFTPTGRNLGTRSAFGDSP